MRVVVTGANGSIGKRLVRLLRGDEGNDVVALVRSESAAAEVMADNPGADVRIVSYHDAADIKAAVERCDVVVHLVGIIKETRSNPFHLAHEAACRALVDAGLQVRHIIVLGIVGTSNDSGNACLKSRANAEEILIKGPAAVTCLRVPMVLGHGDYASYALKKNAQKKLVTTFRSSSLEQPIDADDVLRALQAAIELPPENRVLDLAGPEILTRAALIRKAAERFGNRPLIFSIPVVFGYMLALAFETLLANPPVTRAMLGVLDHDDQIDPASACEILGIKSTPLEQTLEKVLTGPA